MSNQYYYGTKDGENYWFYTEKTELTEIVKVFSNDEYWALIDEANNTNCTIERGSDGLPTLVSVTLTEEEETEIEINNLKQYLQETDYVVIKIAEGAATTDEYADIITKRQEARAKINELEGSE